jgi:23S rRNA (cytosine1962-C5)-methyltransferase
VRLEPRWPPTPKDAMEISGDVILKKGREESIRRFHPWIFSGAIDRIVGKPLDGNWVRVNDGSDGTLGFGHYQKGSIAVRLLSFLSEQPTRDFWRQKIQDAYQQRLLTGVFSPATNAFRLVHGEADGLSGLIVDVYGDVAVVQAHTAGMHADRMPIAEALREVLSISLAAVYFKSHATSTGERNSEYLSGMAAVPHVIREHGHQFYVDWEEGQKTGFFLDQRENRRLLGELAKGKSVLNTFCYTGGFSVYALRAGAKSVHSIDASEKAVALARKNIELNGFDPNEHECAVADTFDFMRGKKDHYDLIVLDPPAFAKHQSAKHQAMKGYQRLNAEAMRIVRPGGLIFTFSCSQVVDRELFYNTVTSAAIQAGRNVSVLHHLSQPADHPVSLYHPEGEYLKGLVLYIR